MTIRPYHPNDKKACIEIFESNSPKYFTKEEKIAFSDWLDDVKPDSYFVLEENNRVIGCGGIYYDEKANEAGLAWGMVHSKFHKQGYGKALTDFRLNKLTEKYPGMSYKIVTSQHTVSFYESRGFITHKITKDGFGVGLDNYEMIKQGSNPALNKWLEIFTNPDTNE